ncbi:MAG: F0F1 ATP synthase subunit delta [Microgenomates group bacterium]|jgi:F0F1-type ATP synthase delta subunit|nr:F0F1 ATP synthase subunit delta [Candidatus Woesebacteria bacterium]
MNDVLSFFEGLILVSDREKLIDQIEMVRREIFAVSNSETLEQTLKKQLSESRAKEFFLYLSKYKKNIYDGHIIEEILESLRGKAMDLDVVRLSLAIDMSRSEISELHTKLTEQLNQRVLLDVHIEPSLLGGLRLEYNGVYLDLSLSTRIKGMIQPSS